MLLSFLSQSVVRPYKYFGEIPLPKIPLLIHSCSKEEGGEKWGGKKGAGGGCLAVEVAQTAVKAYVRTGCIVE